MIYGNEANVIAEEEEDIPKIDVSEELPIIVQVGEGGAVETPETIKQKYESNQSVIDSMARLENTSGTNTGDQDLSSYLLIANLPTSLPASDVYAWAKAEDKPTYTASEVGALPDTYKAAYDSEVVASPTSGNLTLKLSTETVLETALTDSNIFTVVLPTPILGKVNESIMIFTIGATLPTINHPTGIVWRGVVPTLEINQEWAIVYEQVYNGSTYDIRAVAIKNV